MVRTLHSFDFPLHVMSQLVPQMKGRIPELSRIPQWDSIAIVSSSALFLCKVAEIHGITGCLRLEEEFICFSLPP